MLSFHRVSALQVSSIFSKSLKTTVIIVPYTFIAPFTIYKVVSHLLPHFFIARTRKWGISTFQINEVADVARG